ncbi:MAG: hypothetical protein ACXAC8_01215 [Candidatus Hodarchaeales archaeon]
MENLTTVQRLELIFIPLIFLFSQFVIIAIGIMIIGNDIWSYLGMPTLLGLVIGILIGFFINQKYIIHKFSQLEMIFRLVTIGGGITLIPILIAQVYRLIYVYSVFSLLSFILSLMEGLLTVICLILLWRTKSIQEFSV